MQLPTEPYRVTMATKPVLNRIGDICALQPVKSFIVVGIYLSQFELDEIIHELTIDDPPVGARGRLDRIPIFLAESKATVKHGECVQFDSLEGIAYAYVKMDVVN